MDSSRAVETAKVKFAQAAEHYAEELKGLRTGRASAAMLDGVVVQAYGTTMPLNQVANVTAPEPQLIQITPFDPSNIQAIATAIRENQSLGLNPMDDGRVVRVPMPPLTEERRREIVKQVGAKQEECMVRLRNIRHDAMDAVDKAKKEKSIGEDEAKRLSNQIDEAMNKTKLEVESAARSKEADIMSM